MATQHQLQPPDLLGSGADAGPSSASVWEGLRRLFGGKAIASSPNPDPSPVPPVPYPHAVADQCAWLLAPLFESLDTRLDHLSNLIGDHVVRQVPPDLPVEALPAYLQSLERRLDGLSQLFQAKIQDDQAKAELLQKLYEDLARYRDDFLFKHVVADMFHDLIRLDDRLDDALAPETLENLSRADLVDRLCRFQGQVRKTLRRHGVVETRSSPGVTFDPTVQEAIDAVPVTTAGDDQRVMRVQRRGFAYRGKVLRPEKVVVGHYISHEEESHG
jgi:molecular chaperone GrpE